ncbi:hypothetical protein K458DRAFT_287986, partial [Lentithecium fluviatile CBS 122367]
KVAFKTYYRYFKYLLYIYRALSSLLNYKYIIYLDTILIFSKDKNNYKRYV